MEDPILHLGATCGDILKVPLNKLEKRCDFLVAGPPCPPWSSQGVCHSLNDARAEVFLKILEWVYYLAHFGGLIGVVLENVPGITKNHGSKESVMDMFMRVLKKHIPAFAWRVDTLDITGYMCPQTRVRVFLRGLRREFAMEVPAPLPPFGRRTLREVLGKKCEHIKRSDLSNTFQKNLSAFERKICASFARGKFVTDDVCIFHLDRAEGKVFAQSVSLNVAPTLTTRNQYLFVACVEGITKNKPDAEREYFRYLTNAERLMLQGFPPALANDLTRNDALRGTGNAFPVAGLIAVMHPMLSAVSNPVEPGIRLATWPPDRIIQKKPLTEFVDFQKALRQKLKSIPATKKVIDVNLGIYFRIAIHGFCLLGNYGWGRWGCARRGGGKSGVNQA